MRLSRRSACGQSRFDPHSWLGKARCSAALSAAYIVVITWHTVYGGSLTTKNHHFGAGSFKNELWIAEKRVFEKLRGVDVELVTAGAFDWVIGDAAGKEVRTVRHANNNGGWTSIDLPSLGLHGDFSIGIRNASSKELSLKQGEVAYGG
jgi:hypothetical protein